MEPPAAAVIAARWRGSGRSTFAVVGESYDGPFGIDLRKDGPHALIAGTTGSGKSELLQTIVASLAIANRPDEMTFVLVDYKGGSAFADCVRLPHTVGMVTDLDPHQVERALASLSAELTRREHMLAAAGAKDIEDYQPSWTGGRPGRCRGWSSSSTSSRPWCGTCRTSSTGLVNIAQRGRSLGIHLILATQRPSGVVSADIRANTNLRIALRVTDAAESADVIDAPDAATISKSTPGRAYVRLGHGSLVPFQAGRVGGRRPGADAATTARPWVAPLSLVQPGQARARPARRRTARTTEITDLKVLVEQIQYAAKGSASPRQPSPWLPPLPPTPAARRHLPTPPAGSSPAALRLRVRDDRPAGPPTAAAGRAQPGHLQPPDGGRGAALRALATAAHHRRLPGADAQLRGRAPVRDRLRQRRAAAAHRAAALRRGRQPRPDRTRHPAAQAPGGRAEQAAGTARRSRLRRHHEQRAAAARAATGCRTSSSCSTAGKASRPRWENSTTAA